MCNAKAIMIVGTCLAVFSNEDVLSAKLSAKEIAALKAQLKAEILAEIKAEQAKEKAKRLAESKELPRSSSADKSFAVVDQKKSASEPVSDEKYKGYMKSESMKTYININGRVSVSASYANHPTGQGYATSNMFSSPDDTGTNPRTKEFRCGAKNSRLGFSTITPVKLGGGDKDINTMFEVDFWGEQDGSSKLNNSHKPRIRHAYLDCGPILVGQTDSVFCMDGMEDMIDDADPIGCCGIRQPQVRYTLKFDESTEWACALENPETDGVDKDGNDISKYDGNRTNALDLFPDLVSKVTRKMDGMDLSVAGVLRYLRVQHKNEDKRTDSKFSRLVGYGAAFGGKFYLTDKDVGAASLRVGNGAGRYIGDGSIAGVFVKNKSEDKEDKAELQKSVGVNLSIQHYWDKDRGIRSNLGLEFSKGFLADEIKSNKKSGLFQSGYIARANLVWSPIINAMDLGVEYVFGHAWLASQHRINVTRIAASLTYKF